jgi:hypothetical protein
VFEGEEEQLRTLSVSEEELGARTDLACVYAYRAFSTYSISDVSFMEFLNERAKTEIAYYNRCTMSTMYNMCNIRHMPVSAWMSFPVTLV